MSAPRSKQPPEHPAASLTAQVGAGSRALWGGYPAWGALALICCASILVLAILGTKLTFFNDDWYFLLQRPGLEGSSILSPHNGQLVVGVDLSYKALVALWGFDQLPFRLLLGGAVAALGVVVYLLVTERLGSLLGLVAATLIVFLGPAWEALLFFASIGPVIALAAGLAALLLLEHDHGRRNAAACLLLTVAVAFSGVGVPFVIAAALAVALRGKPVQLWIPGIPAALYGIWWLTRAGDANTGISLSNLAQLPGYVLDSAAYGLASLTGLNQGPHHELQAHLLVAVTAVGTAAWLLRGGRPTPQLAVFAAAALSFWGLAGLGFHEGREPAASRYQLVSAVLVVVIAAELLRSVRPRPWQYALVVFCASLALVSNLERLDEGYRVLRAHSLYAKADIGALELAAGQVPPELRLIGPVALDDHLAGITADRYFEETREHGALPHYSPEQIAVAHPALRQAADSVLAASYGLPTFAVGRRPAGGRCRRLATRPDAGGEAAIAPGGAYLKNRGTEPLTIQVRRFAPPVWVSTIGYLDPGSAGTVSVASDSVALPWRLSAQGGSPLLICSPA